jgi:hypothetical protein
MMGLLDLALRAGVVGRCPDGTLVLFDGERLGSTREDAATFLRLNPDVAKRLEWAVQQRFMPAGAP